MSEIILRIPECGAEARILPEQGFNCFAFQAAVGGRLVDCLWSDPAFATGTCRPTRSGIPILFPFPNRIRQGRFHWEGRDYVLPTGDGKGGDGKGNAIHGLVFDRPWRVMATDEQTAFAEFQLSVDAPDRAELWPSDFLISVRYSLYPTLLRADIRLVNAGSRPMPWGLGTHPYFCVPLGGESRMEDCLVQLPATQVWELENSLPTGKRHPVSGRTDLREGVSLNGIELDDVLTGVSPRNGKIQSVVMDARSGVQITQTTDSVFREWVVFTPPTRASVCLEPYTCVTDAVNLQQQGLDTGWRVMKPGDELRTWFQIEASLIYA